ncbi:MAG: hypothetical protein OXI56_13230 [bacterium]|nr:hypothetical protein [bacterium]MDE0602749.1 hypothetical protein [bacterium]
MAVDTLIAEEGWAGRPATKGDLMVVQTRLENKIKDVEGKIRDVEGMIKDVRIEVGNGDNSLKLEIGKLRVSIAWMTIGITTLLGGLITLFEFLS